MTFINLHAAHRACHRFASKYDREHTYSYRFELEDDGRCSVGIYSDKGTFLGYV